MYPSLLRFCQFLSSTADFSPDDRLAASGSDDKTVKTWDVEKGGDCLTSYHDHNQSVNSVTFHPSGTCIASGSSDHSIRLYDIRSDVLMQYYPNSGNRASLSAGVSSISFHQNGNYLLSSSSDGAKIWDVRKGMLLYTMHSDGKKSRTHDGTEASCCAFSSDGKSFACGGTDRIVSIYNTPQEISSAYDNGSRISHKKIDKLSASHEKNKQKQPSQHFLARDILPTGCYKDRNEDNRLVNKSNQNYTIEDFAGEDVICDTVLESANESLTKGYIVPPHKGNGINGMLAGTLDHIIGQLDLLTRTLAMIDKRLAVQETTVALLTNNLSIPDASRKPNQQKDSTYPQRTENKSSIYNTHETINNHN
mmetsp:Transcript_56253/g.65710  ORF Transcript_56253/g.65710 Transcript_56253/m.65710 type:complete len:364 (+) Transcript_56253:1062-2153(+)